MSIYESHFITYPTGVYQGHEEWHDACIFPKKSMKAKSYLVEGRVGVWEKVGKGTLKTTNRTMDTSCVQGQGLLVFWWKGGRCSLSPVTSVICTSRKGHLFSTRQPSGIILLLELGVVRGGQ